MGWLWGGHYGFFFFESVARQNLRLLNGSVRVMLLIFCFNHIIPSASTCVWVFHFLAVTTSGLVFHCNGLLLAVLLALLPSDVFVLVPALNLFAPVLIKVFAFVDFLKNIMIMLASRAPSSRAVVVVLFLCSDLSYEWSLLNTPHFLYINNISVLSHSLSCFSLHRLSNNTSWLVHVILLERSQKHFFIHLEIRWWINIKFFLWYIICKTCSNISHHSPRCQHLYVIRTTFFIRTLLDLNNMIFEDQYFINEKNVHVFSHTFPCEWSKQILFPNHFINKWMSIL